MKVEIENAEMQTVATVDEDLELDVQGNVPQRIQDEFVELLVQSEKGRTAVSDSADSTMESEEQVTPNETMGLEYPVDQNLNRFAMYVSTRTGYEASVLESESKADVYRLKSKREKGLSMGQSRVEEMHRRTRDKPEECFRCLEEAFREQVFPEGMTKAPSWTSDDDVTVSTQEWIDSVIQLEDPIWDAYADIPQAQAITIKMEIRESLTQHQGWSLDSIDRRLRNKFPYLSKNRRQIIARQETAAVINRAKRVELEARPDGEDEIVRWVGPDDFATTDLCTSVKDEIPDEGITFAQLKAVLEAAAEEYPEGTPQRVDQLLPHWQCRHTVEIVDE